MSDTSEPPPAVADDESEQLPAEILEPIPEGDLNILHAEQSQPPTDAAVALNDSDELNVTEKLAISDSDGDGDDDDAENETPSKAASHESEADGKSTEVVPVSVSAALQTAQKRFMAIIDSDSEEESVQARQTKPADEDSDADALPKSVHKRVPGIVDSDNDSDTAQSKTKRPAKAVLSSSSSSSSSDGGDSDEDNEKSAKVASKKHLKKSASSMPASQKLANQLCDSSSDDEDYQAPAEDNAFDDGTATPKPPVARPPKRASAREAEDQMKTIQSESQRLAREASLTVPYHRPKQHSLQTFLSRRTVTKPTDVRPDAKKAAASIKMSHEELERYAAHLDERAKESELFYKSDDDDGGDGEMRLETEQKSVATIEDAEDAVTAAPASESVPPVDPIDASVPKPQDEDTPSDTKPAPSRLELLQERVRAQLDTSDIGVLSPSLRGAANTIIDLDSGDVLPAPPPTGPIELYQRYLQHSAKPKAKAAATGGSLRILCADAGGVSVDTAVYASGGGASEEVIQDSKPRSAFFKLKAALGEKLAEKRREVIRERQREAEEVNGKGCYSDEDDDEDMPEEKAIDDEEEDEVANNVEKPIDDQKADNEPDKMDDQPDDDVDEADEAEEASDETDGDEPSDLPKIRKRIVLPEDSDDETTKPEPLETLSQFAPDPPSNLDDMLNVCSTLPVNTTSDDVNASSFMTQNGDVTESQLVDLCSGAFMTQAPSSFADASEDIEGEAETDAVAVRAAFESSDEDEADPKPKASKVPVAKPKIVPLSDDEEDDGPEEAAVDTAEPQDVEYDSEENEIAVDKSKKLEAADSSDEEDEDDAEADDAPIADVEYDSEENEIKVVHRTANKKERRRRAGAFIENEAELSESEWGSSDEDEQHMDRMDAEFGDGEQFDDDKLREELATIHTRRMLDDDARAVKHIAAELLHEEDAEGDQRDRQFKWKNMNDTNWASDELARRAADATDGGADGTQRDSDEENEEAWRKMRYERETMLKDMERSSVTAADGQTTTAPLNALTGQENALDGTLGIRKRKINVIRGATNAAQPMDMKPSSFLIGQAKTELQGTRNSFLARDEQTLNRLANMIKNDEDGEGGIVGRAGVTKGHGNFLFSTVSPTKQASGKRKSEANVDADDETASKRQKKVGDETRRTTNAAGGVPKKRLLDSLT